jgi:hypothetical protein
MSSVVISGDTSGTVTLQAPAIAGTTVLTLPATSGTIITTASGTASSATTATNITGGVAGAIPYQFGSGATGFSAAGSSGQLLQSNGSSAPSWVTASASGLTLLSTVTASNSATVDIETTFSSTYDSYIIVCSNVAPSADSVNLRALLKINGTYQTSGYNYHSATPANTSSAYAAQGASAQAFISIMGGIATNSRATTPGSTCDLHIRINAPTNTATIKSISWNGSTAGNTNSALFGSGQFVTSFEALTGIRFQYGSGNILTGTFRLYGFANS